MRFHMFSKPVLCLSVALAAIPASAASATTWKQLNDECIAATGGAKGESACKAAIEAAEKENNANGVISSTINLSTHFVQKKDFESALNYSKRVLALQEKRLGANHPAVASALNTMGEHAAILGRKADAEQAFQRALRIFESSGGKDSPDAKKTRERLKLLNANSRPTMNDFRRLPGPSDDNG